MLCILGTRTSFPSGEGSGFGRALCVVAKTRTGSRAWNDKRNTAFKGKCMKNQWLKTIQYAIPRAVVSGALALAYTAAMPGSAPAAPLLAPKITKIYAPASDRRDYHRFGESPKLSATGDLLVAGASHDYEGGFLAGALYIFERDLGGGRRSWPLTKPTVERRVL